MAIDFYFGNTIDEADYEGLHGALTEEVGDLVYESKESLNFDVKHIIDLDPSGDTLLDKDKSKNLYDSISNILESRLVEKMGAEDLEGLEKLQILLKMAIKTDQKVIGIGD
jgi:hypothetical protein